MPQQALQLGVCVIITTVLALTSHIYISEWVQPIVELMVQGQHSEPYSSFVIIAAYGTAFITVGLVVFLYYHTQHLLPISSNFLKAIVVACILLS